MPIAPKAQSAVSETPGPETPPPSVLVDFLPALRGRHGRSPRKSGERLAADLRAARKGVVDMIWIIDNKLPVGETCQTGHLRETLNAMLTEIDGVDPHNPPVQAAFDLFSHRAQLIATALRLIVQKHLADDILSRA